MAQTDQQKNLRRPGRRRYKNRKKTLRLMHQAGKITAAERAHQQEKARLEFLESPMTVGAGTVESVRGRLWWEKMQAEGTPEHMSAAVHAVLAGEFDRPGGSGMCGADSCAGAWGENCKCSCEGVFHGAANGGAGAVLNRDGDPIVVSDEEVDEAMGAARAAASELSQRRTTGHPEADGAAGTEGKVFVGYLRNRDRYGGAQWAQKCADTTCDNALPAGSEEGARCFEHRPQPQPCHPRPQEPALQQAADTQLSPPVRAVRRPAGLRLDRPIGSAYHDEDRQARIAAKKKELAARRQADR